MRGIPLTAQDRKVIKKKMKPASTPVIGALIFSAFIILAALFLREMPPVPYVFAGILLPASAFVTHLIVNRNYLGDLKDGFKQVGRYPVTEKTTRSSGGNKDAPDNPSFFQKIKEKLAQDERKEYKVYYLVANKEMIKVTKAEFDKTAVGDPLYLYYAPHSNTFLGSDKPERQ